MDTEINPSSHVPPLPESVLSSQWHYLHGTVHVGPVTEEEMNKKIKKGIIRPDTLVFRHGMRDWGRADHTTLHFPTDRAVAVDSKPLMSNLWLIILLPIIDGIISRVMGNGGSGLEIFWLLTIAVVYYDVYRIKQAGALVTPIDYWYVWFVPVYIIRRCWLLRMSYWWFGLWILSFIISIFIG